MNSCQIQNLIATPETDLKLAIEYHKKGSDAYYDGVNREDCPFDGMIKVWWLEGWDSKNNLKIDDNIWENLAEKSGSVY